jgi:hypothetical protein
MLIQIIIMTVIPGLIAGALAARKGYSFGIWLLTGTLSLVGLIVGLIALAFLPYANKASAAEEQTRLKKKGNAVGGSIAMAGILLIIYIMSIVTGVI